MSLFVGGEEYHIRTDFRAILDILAAYNEPDFSDSDKLEALINILYKDNDRIPADCMEEAVQKAVWFIDAGTEPDQKQKPKTIDWMQDASIIVPAINKVAGKEVRSEAYLHWWTFYGYFMEIGEGLLSQVVGIRQKRARGKKLESWEKEFYRNNRELCELKRQYTAEEKETLDRLNQLFC